MSQCTSHYFGVKEYAEDAVLEFPAGLPGFESERRFLTLESPQHRPAVFLQSLATPDLCFITLPVQTVDRTYDLNVARDDLERLGFRHRHAPAIGTEVLCLAIVTVKESGPTVNLRAPIVVNLKARVGVQAIAPCDRYSHQHPL